MQLYLYETKLWVFLKQNINIDLIIHSQFQNLKPKFPILWKWERIVFSSTNISDTLRRKSQEEKLNGTETCVRLKRSKILMKSAPKFQDFPRVLPFFIHVLQNYLLLTAAGERVCWSRPTSGITQKYIYVSII